MVPVFFLYKRVNGRPDKIKIGRFPEITVEQARKAAYRLINDITLGVNPKEKKVKKNNAVTLRELFDDFLEKHAKLHKKHGEKIFITLIGIYHLWHTRK